MEFPSDYKKPPQDRQISPRSRCNTMPNLFDIATSGLGRVSHQDITPDRSTNIKLDDCDTFEHLDLLDEPGSGLKNILSL